MNTMDDVFKSRFLKAADLKGRELLATIESHSAEILEGEKNPKLILRLVGEEKEFIVNRTNAETIAASYGRAFPGWHGRQIVLFVMPVQGPQGLVDGIRVRIPVTQPAAPASVTTTQSPSVPTPAIPAPGSTPPAVTNPIQD